MTVKFSPPPREFSTLGRGVMVWLEALANKRTALQADSTATTVADLRTDVNALLAKLRVAGLMEE